MNQRSSNRLERRAERAGRRPGNTTPPPSRRRSREPQRVGRTGGTGFLPFSPLALGVGAGVVALVVILYYLVTQTGAAGGDPGWLKAELNADTSIPGLFVKPNPGPDGKFGTTDDREHFAPGTKRPICSADVIAADAAVTDAYAQRDAVKDCYNSNPPTSGPHSSTPMPFKVLDNPAPKENLLHNMEHGGVIIWYNTDDQAVIDQLKAVANENIDRRRFVAMTRYAEMEPNTIAVTSWTRLDKFPTSDYNKKRVQDFINENHKRFNPEGF